MEEIPLHRENDVSSSDRTAAAVLLDIESLAQLADRSCGSPKMTRALSRKWSYRTERIWNGPDQEDDIDNEPAKKLQVKGNSQLEPLKQPSGSSTNKGLIPVNITPICGSNLMDTSDGRNKRLNRIMGMNPRKIVFIFASLSSMGTLMLICFTLAINRTI